MHRLATGNSVVGDTSVTFTAMPQSATGYTFDGWTVNGKKREGTDETLTLNITENTTVSAAYTLNTVSLRGKLRCHFGKRHADRKERHENVRLRRRTACRFDHRLYGTAGGRLSGQGLVYGG